MDPMETEKDLRKEEVLLGTRGSDCRRCSAEGITHLFQQAGLRSAGYSCATVRLDRLLTCGTILSASAGLLISQGGFWTGTAPGNEKR
jgi:hypothetical protein